MSIRAIINKRLKAALVAAGFTITTPSTDSVEAVVAWPVRKNMHRYMAGQRLMDHRDMVQFGDSEVKAQSWETRVLVRSMLNMGPVAAHIDNPIWICGPGAAYVATGTAQMLTKLSAELRRLFPEA